MDAVRLGRQIRALRRHRSWRQLDLGTRARVSRAFVARIEGGGASRVSVEKLERVAGALGARLELRLSWNGEALDRLMDAGHAGLVDRLVTGCSPDEHVSGIRLMRRANAHPVSI